MKTLRNTIVIASIAICLFASSALAQTKDDNAYVREQLIKLLERSSIADQGIVDLSFVLKNNHIKVKHIESGKPWLDKALANYLENQYIKQQSVIYSFHVRINLNSAVAQNDKAKAPAGADLQSVPCSAKFVLLSSLF